MADFVDSGVGAILSIPSQALRDIQKAENALISLHEQSKKTANQIYGDFATRLPLGIDKFIQKVEEARKKLGTLDINVNVTGVQGQMDAATNAVRVGMSEISRTVQQGAQVTAGAWEHLLPKKPIAYNDLLLFDSAEKDKVLRPIQDIEKNIQELINLRKTLEGNRSIAILGSGDKTFNVQQLTDLINYMQRYVELLKTASIEKDKAIAKINTTAKNKTDKEYLDYQKQSYKTILDLKRQINEQSIKVEKGTITKSSTLEKDKKDLKDLRDRLASAQQAWIDYNTASKRDNLSDKGAAEARTKQIEFQNNLLKEQRAYQNDLNAAIIKGNEYIALGQQGKSRIGNSDEAAIQRQLNSDYKGMIKIIRERGEIEAKAKEQGRRLTQQEINLIGQLGQRYKIYYDDINRISGAYAKMGEAAAANFARDKSEQLARNAVLLADAQNKAAQAAQKSGLALRDTASIKADLDAVNQKLIEEWTNFHKIRNEVAEAKAKLDEFKNTNLTWGRGNDAVLELDRKRQRIVELQTLMTQTPTGSNKYKKYEYELNLISKKYDELSQKVTTYRTLVQQADEHTRLEKSNRAITALEDRQDALNKKLREAQNINAALNAEMAKGNTASGIAKEYANLTKRLHEVNKAMNDYLAAGGSQKSGAYQALEAEFMRIQARRKEIEKTDIAEVNQYRQSIALQANQAELSAFIQMEAQKTAAAKQAADQQAADRRAATQKMLNTEQGALWYSNRIKTGATADTYENRKIAIKRLENAIKSLNKSDADYEQRLKKLTDALHRLKEAQKGVTDAMKPTKPMVSPQDAINAAKNARTLKDLEAAYKQLKAVMSTTNPNDPKWAEMNRTLRQTKTEIDNIRKKMGELKEQTRNTASTMSQLRNWIAGAFSVSAIKGYLKKMVEVRGQFELQNVALRAIIQNKDEADKIFLQVQQMALQSPFSILQMTTFTKQLAAYRIESEKLVGTTKMLADVSAGLGISMDRLILAYGQVKAANYLRATEVRQFTEAGLNIAGELANYFSELQDKMVSVGDVMDMITKRMVKFEDVEEVFKRVTSAGGIFYDMQKKQSDTLTGMMQRITDAYSIMLNDIGKSNDSVIKKGLQLVRELIGMWRRLAPAIEHAAMFMGVFLAYRGISSMVLGVTKLTVGVMNLSKGLMAAKAAAAAAKVSFASLAAFAPTGIGLLVVGIATAIEYFIGLRNEANALNEELGRISFESGNDLKESIAEYLQLTKVINDSSKSYTEQREALDSLKRIYKDILPSHMLESEWIRQNTTDYAEATEMIKEYFRAREMQKQVDAILNSKDYTDAVKKMKELGENMLKQGMFDASVTKKYTDAWMEQIAHEIATGEIENSAKAVSDRLSEIFGEPIKVSDAQWQEIFKYFERLDGYINNISLGTMSADTHTQQFAKDLSNMSTEKIQNLLDSAKNEQKNLLDTIQELEKAYTEKGIPQAGARASELKEKYKELTSVVDDYGVALVKAYARKTDTEIEERIGAINKEIEAINTLTVKRNKALQTNTVTEEERQSIERLNNELNNAITKTLELANAKGITLDEAELKNIDNAFTLQKLLGKIHDETYPKFAQEAVDAVKKGEVAMDGLVSRVNVLQAALDKMAQGSSFLQALISFLNGTTTAADEDAAAADAAWEKESQRNKEYIKQAAQRAGINQKLITQENDLVLKRNKSATDYAKVLRTKAKAWKDELANVEGVSEAERRFYLQSKHLSMETLRERAKAAVALEDIANAYDPKAEKKKGGRSSQKDPWIELFKQRDKAIQDFYKQYETLRDKFSEDESQRRDMASFADLFKAVGLEMQEVVSKGFGTQGLIDNLVELREQAKKHFGAIYEEAEKIAKKGLTIDAIVNPTAEQRLTYDVAKIIVDLEKQIADNKIKLDFEVQENALEALKKDFSDIFDKYELTKELGNLGLNVDITYLVGGKPMTIADAKKQLTETYNSKSYWGDLGKDAEKAYKEAMKKIADIENKAAQQRLKNYSKYLIESMSERVQIEMKAHQQINKLRASEELDDTTKQMAVYREYQNMKKQLAQQQWKDFQGSESYIMLFEDIQQASSKSINYVINKLKSLRGSLKELPADQLKAIMKQIDKLEDEAATRNPFKAFKDNIGTAILAIRNLAKEESKLHDTENKLSAAKTTRDNTQRNVALLEEQLKIEQEKLRQQSQGRITGNGITQQLKMQLETHRAILNIQNQQVDTLEKEKDRLAQVIADLRKGGALAGKSLQQIGSWSKEISSGIGNIASSMEDVFGTMSDGTRDTIESIQEIMNGVGDMASGIGRAMSGDVFGGVTQAVVGLASTIGSIFNISDKKKERQIKRLAEKVEDLGKAYDKLHDKMEEAYTFNDYNAGFKSSMKNLDEQEKALKEMIRLEEDKKKTDKDKLKEYNEQLEQIAEARKQLREERYEQFGSVAEKGYQSEAENFVSVWLDAYKETGDGLDALTEHWDEFFENLVLKQAASMIMSKRMEKYIGAINDVIDKGLTGTDLLDELQPIIEQAKADSIFASNELKELFQRYGIGGVGELLLSDLQKGIQNITEPQAAAIEAYLNSMRFAVFRQNEQLDTLIATIQAQYGVGESPMLKEVRGIRSVLDNIYSTLQSVIGKNGMNNAIRMATR